MSLATNLFPHRALIINAVAEGRAEISGLLEGEDCLATLSALRMLGVQIDRRGSGAFTVHGHGLFGLQAPQGALDFGNSGTALRLMAGLLCGQPFPSILSGDASLSRRPMARIVRPLNAMGASIKGRSNRPPLRIEPVAKLLPIRYGMMVASAQVKSALLLASLYADGETVITEPAPCRDHTERLLSAMGVDISSHEREIRIVGPARLTARDIAVPADLSSAAFFIVAATVAGREPVTLPAIGVNPTRTGVLDILRAMGAKIELGNERMVGGEPVADITVAPASLRGIDVDPELVPLAIDEFPVLFVAAAAADGTTRFRGIEELRNKESDRIGAMAEGLAALGVACTTSADEAQITGGEFSGGAVHSCGDHRVAMSFAVAGSVASGPVEIDDVKNVDTSFPGFEEQCRRVGLRLAENPAA